MHVDGIGEGCIGIRGIIYKLGNFDHPGGRLFLDMCEGMDATRLFETHHIHIHRAEDAVRGMQVVGAYTVPNPQCYRLYSKLRKNVATARRRLGFNPRPWVWFEIAIVLHVCCARCALWSVAWMVCCVAYAFANTICGGYGHDGLHRLDSTAILLDWNGLSALEWLLEHIMSHHMHVNTIADHDAIAMLPFLRFLPGEKPRGSTIVKHAIFAIAEIVVAIHGNFGHRVRWMATRLPAAPWFIRLGPWLFWSRVATLCWMSGFYHGLVTILLTSVLASYYFAYLAHLSHSTVHTPTHTDDFVHTQLANTRDIRGGNAEALLFLDRQSVHHLFPSIPHLEWTPELVDVVRRNLPDKLREITRPQSLSSLHSALNRQLCTAPS